MLDIYRDMYCAKPARVRIERSDAAMRPVPLLPLSCMAGLVCRVICMTHWRSARHLWRHGDVENADCACDLWVHRYSDFLVNELTAGGEVVRLTSILPITKPERAPAAAKQEQQLTAAEEGNDAPAADAASSAQAATAVPGAVMSFHCACMTACSILTSCRTVASEVAYKMSPYPLDDAASQGNRLWSTLLGIVRAAPSSVGGSGWQQDCVPGLRQVFRNESHCFLACRISAGTSRSSAGCFCGDCWY